MAADRPGGKRLKKYGPVLFWLLVWQLGSMALAAAYPHGALLLPSPGSAALRLAALLPEGAFWLVVGRSAGNIAAGFVLSCLLAVLLAALAAGRPWLQALLEPVVSAVKAVPVASFVILALVWLDGASLSRFISGLMVFPPVYLNVLEGIRQRDSRLLEMARLFRTPLFRRLRGLDLPQVLPYFRTAVSLALGLCWKAGVAAEVIGLPSGTVGERLYMAKVYLMTADLFAWTAVIVAVSALFERLFLTLTDRLTVWLLPGGSRKPESEPAEKRRDCSGTAAGRVCGEHLETVKEIRVEHLSKSYDGKIVLEDLSFTAGPGITCVMAPSGAGKTTLLRILMGLETADEGRVSPLECRWAAVFQEDRLLEDLTAAGNLRFTLGEALDLRQSAALLETLGLDLRDPRPVRLWSGGMKRRLALARALLAPAGALALDEPFTGLDEALRARCMACVRRAAETRPVLLVTHDSASAKGLPLIRLDGSSNCTQ